ncbi:anti-sigma factor family protein [Pseudomonas subflava]|uniref:anti-sigma factor family protein n=1 Tax=Pseudomonas subflava TaxID=2952933 RepID=UPI00207AB6AB|nr:zf-HC2 domain-containing protein [Pseudomonas subflava]
MLTCRDLVARSSGFLDGHLRLHERLGVRAHLALCGHCRRFIRQMELSRAVLRHLPEPDAPELEALAERLACERRQR